MRGGKDERWRSYWPPAALWCVDDERVISCQPSSPRTMAPLDLRPRSGVELIDASFQFMRENFALLFTAVAVTYAPIALLEDRAALDPSNVMAAMLGGLAAWFFSAFAQAAVIRIVAAPYMGEDITAAE